MNDRPKFEAGQRVVIRHNPFHEDAKEIVGSVVTYRAGIGFGGCDLVDVRYINPIDSEEYVRPFSAEKLMAGGKRVLTKMAERHEAIAKELRDLADS